MTVECDPMQVMKGRLRGNFKARMRRCGKRVPVQNPTAKPHKRYGIGPRFRFEGVGKAFMVRLKAPDPFKKARKNAGLAAIRNRAPN